MDKILGIINLHTESNFGNLTKKKNIETTNEPDPYEEMGKQIEIEESELPF